MKLLRYIVMFTLVLTLGVLAQGCHNEKEEEIDVQLTIRTLSVSKDANSQFIVVNAPGEWSLTANQSWVKINPSSGSGNYSKIVLSCEDNPNKDGRTAIVSLQASGQTVDITITQEGTSHVTPPDPSGDGVTHQTYGWLELPAFNTKTYKFIYHNMESSGHSGRSFSYLWSKGDLVALWVAYPLNSGLISSGSRTDYWGTDPKLSSDEQPILYSAFVGGYDRGHQLPSADRLSYKDNVKTFYFTNMTPQLNSLNGQLWATLEGRVRAWANKSDTLYVVTGCVISGSTKKAYDNNGKAVTVPVGYYKAVLRYLENATIGHNGYLAFGIYLEHRAYSEKSVTKAMSMSIDDLEKKLNIDLFPNLIDKVGETAAQTIEAEKPADVSWWWN